MYSHPSKWLQVLLRKDWRKFYNIYFLQCCRISPHRYGPIFNGLWIWILAQIQVLYKESWLFVIITVLRLCFLILVFFFWFNMLSSILIICSHISPLGILCFMNHFNSSLGVKPKLMSLQHCWLLADKCQHLISQKLSSLILWWSLLQSMKKEPLLNLFSEASGSLASEFLIALVNEASYRPSGGTLPSAVLPLFL